MDIIKKRYTVYGWKGIVHLLTAKELYDRVMVDSKFNYNWIASATELVRVCCIPDFPKEYADEIKLAILNCFSNIGINRAFEVRTLATDDEAVWCCYNSLSGTDEKIVQVKHKYLIAVIESITLNYFELPIHCGPTYRKMCADWRKSKFDDNINKEKIDFALLIKELGQDFDDTIRTAEKEGAFKKEDEERIKRMVDYAFKLCD